MHPVVWNSGLHRLNAFLNDLRIFLVKKDTEAEDATGVLGDAAVSQVEPE
jgi:hypothetical protein